MGEELLESLAADPMSRLRWRVTERFLLPPDTALSDSDILWAAGNMVLDLRTAADRKKAGENPAFDQETFLKRRSGI